MGQEIKTTDDEIVEQLGTTKSYVQKVKSQSKSTKGKIGASDIKHEEVIDEKRFPEINQETTILPEHKPSSISEEKSLTKNDLRKIYSFFFKGKTPSKIVAKMGYQHEVLEADAGAGQELLKLYDGPPRPSALVGDRPPRRVIVHNLRFQPIGVYYTDCPVVAE